MSWASCFSESGRRDWAEAMVASDRRNARTENFVTFGMRDCFMGSPLFATWRGVVIADIEERILHSVTRRAKTARGKKPGHCGRYDNMRSRLSRCARGDETDGLGGGRG